MESLARASLKTYGSEERSHAHDHHQVVVPWRGVLDMRIGARAGQVDTSRLALVTQGIDHSFASDDDNRFLVLDCGALDGEGGGLTDPLWDRAQRDPYWQLHPHVWQLCRVMEPYFLNSRTREDSLARHFVGLFLATVAEGRDETNPTRTGRPDRAAQRIQAAIAYMESHYPAKLTIPDIAAHVNLSPSRFHELFRIVTGQTAHATLRQIRLQAAKRLIETTTLSRAEIAYRTGFSDQSALSRALRC